MLLATITSLALVFGNGANPRKTPVPVSMTRADAHADRYEETPSFDASGRTAAPGTDQRRASANRRITPVMGRRTSRRKPVPR